MKAILVLISVFSATAAFAAPATYTYNCKYKSGDDSQTEYVLKVTGKKATLKDGALDDGGTVDKLDRDENYTPQKANKNFYMYSGMSSTDGYQVEVLIERDLVGGADGGSMKIRARGEGFFNTTYSCENIEN